MASECIRVKQTVKQVLKMWDCPACVFSDSINVEQRFFKIFIIPLINNIVCSENRTFNKPMTLCITTLL